jgi:hypothetical protein
MITATELRQEIVHFLSRELMGPDPRPEMAAYHHDEILRPQDPPRIRFTTGVLFPDRARSAENEVLTDDEALATETAPVEGDVPEEVRESVHPSDAEDLFEHSTTEHEVNRANEFLPSAMGLTALVRLPPKLKVRVMAGRYVKRAVEGLGKQDEKDGSWREHWYRYPIEKEVVIDTAPLLAESRRVLCGTDGLWVDTGDPSLRLEIHLFSRPLPERSGHLSRDRRERLVTFTLINRNKNESSSVKDEHCFFQCRFKVESADGVACFMEYPERADVPLDDEEASLRLLYRHRKTFAIGHGCAAAWPDSESDSVREINTDVLPAYSIQPVIATGAGLALSMRRLSAGTIAEITDICSELTAAYDNWIGAQERAVTSEAFGSEHLAAAQRHLQLCRSCLERVRGGIELLRDDETVRLAFGWMNAAMLDQQVHYELATRFRREWRTNGWQPELEKSMVEALDAQQAEHERHRQEKGREKFGEWRPFQLAFILMNLKAISQRQSPEREIADLIWFPTGGGKTEAYLGLTAFSILWRRLENPLHGGVTVLMRYTLRLLTTQQFQRAASLICALENLRRCNQHRLGRERVSIGLWVGGKVTPNQHGGKGGSVAMLRALHGSGDSEPNPFVMLSCPWCGAAMGPVKVRNAWQTPGYVVQGSKVVFRCGDSFCDFHRADLPLHVVDESIYEERPTLVIATVDKFALIPWRKETRAFFGGGLSDLPPPELIIQDELHLIAGALGSMVGHYETTLDALTRHGSKRWPAKIVASTATICRAADQVKKLYNRDLCLFPPQGLRAGDSFFAAEDCKNPGRLYVGVFGSAVGSHVTAQVRVFSALLQAAKSAAAATPEVTDPYWTLMAYFNSLRELGHAATLVRADIREYMNALWHRIGIKRPEDKNAHDPRRFIDCPEELTSRIQSDQVTNVLQRLFESYKVGIDADGRKQNRAIDFCLATNMIQVGLDVPRLGLMAVVGQPKATSEYIQATSRVGRSDAGPGLVVTIYNPSKPRDRSYYEHFRSYHQSIYRAVEPTSVTPFAIPVRERALHAQIVTLVRHWGEGPVRDSPRPVPDDALLRRVRETLLRRVAEVDREELEGTAALFDEWVARWRRCEPAVYGDFRPPELAPLMMPAGSEPLPRWAGIPTKTLTSMRNVDAGCDAAVIQEYPNLV